MIYDNVITYYIKLITSLNYYHILYIIDNMYKCQFDCSFNFSLYVTFTRFQRISSSLLYHLR